MVIGHFSALENFEWIRNPFLIKETSEYELKLKEWLISVYNNRDLIIKYTEESIIPFGLIWDVTIQQFHKNLWIYYYNFLPHTYWIILIMTFVIFNTSKQRPARKYFKFDR